MYVRIAFPSRSGLSRFANGLSPYDNVNATGRVKKIVRNRLVDGASLSADHKADEMNGNSYFIVPGDFRVKLISRTTLVAGMFIAAVGCGGGNSAAPKTTASSSSAAAARPAEIELHQVSATGFESLLADAKGKPVLVDFWFLGCAPCKKKFPHIVELQERYSPDGLVVMSYSIMAEDWKEKNKVVSFLNEKKAHFQHYVAKTTDDSDKVTAKYGIEFTPAILLLDRTGKRIPVPEEVTDEELEGLIRQAMRQS